MTTPSDPNDLEISRLLSRARRDVEDAIRIARKSRLTTSIRGRRVGGDLLRVLQAMDEVSSLSSSASAGDSEEERILQFRAQKEAERDKRRKKASPAEVSND